MKEKLTLTIEKETKRRAKQHAKATGNSISEMVEEFLNAISAETTFQPESGSITESIMGSMPLQDKRPYKEILTDELKKKYLNDEDID